MESLQELWTLVSAALKDELSSVAFNSWISILKPVSLDNSTLTLSVRTLFQKGIVENNYLGEITSICEQIAGFPITVVLQSEQKLDPSAENGADDSEFTFENFIVAESNNFAFSAAQSVAKKPGEFYNPLFIYGDSGLGKTHLLTAIKNTIAAQYPNYRIISVQGEEFMNEFIDSIERHTQAEFRKKFRQCDLLLLDDIQFIANKAATQEEFFHTFTALTNAKKQIVLTSDRPPREILSLDSRLRTRFETGLADISSPDYETRVAIAKKKAEMVSLPFTDEIAEYIAERIKNNVRQIQAVIIRLNARYRLSGQEPTLNYTMEVCRDITNDVVKPAITVDMIKNEISRVYQIPVEDFSSKKQNAQTSFVRQIAMYVCRELTSLTLEEIGDAFGGRHYTTVHYSITTIEESIQSNPSLKASAEDIIKNIKSKV